MKRIVQVCGAILVLSLVLGLAGCLMGGRPRSVNFGSGWFDRWDFVRNEHTDAGSVQMPDGTITSLEFDLGGAEVTVRGGESFSLEVLHGSLRKNQVQNGVWMLENGVKDLSGAEIVVTVPQDQVLDRLNLEVGAGKLNLENLHCKTAEFEVGVGSLNAAGVTVEERSDLTVELGQLQLDGSLLGRTAVQCEMGDVTLNLEKPAEYGYRVTSDMGSVSIDGQSYGGMGTELEMMRDASNFYEIDCDMGSVNLEFQ